MRYAEARLRRHLTNADRSLEGNRAESTKGERISPELHGVIRGLRTRRALRCGIPLSIDRHRYGADAEHGNAGRGWGG